MKKRIINSIVGFVVLLALGIPAAFAELERVGPVDEQHGYPIWYQDKTGVTLEFGAPLNQTEFDGGWVGLAPTPGEPIPQMPETFPSNFQDEHFYWAADAGIDFDLPDGEDSSAELVLGLEAAFAIGPVQPGDQVVFGRLRIRIRDLPYSGTYRVYTPYGDRVFTDQVAGERLFHTEDIGLSAPLGDFNAALKSSIGPFLLPSNIPGGAELPPVTGPVSGKLYIADPGREGTVTGSPLPPFVSPVDGLTRNHNIFRVEGPNGFVIETYDFSLAGRIYTGPIPGRTVIDRASYSRTVDSQKLDIFATGLSTTQTRLPGSPIPPPIKPILSFYPAPVVEDDNGNLLPPEGFTAIPMSSHDHSYWGQIQPSTIPSGICVVDSNSRDAAGNVISTFSGAPVTDEVAITEAFYDPSNGGTLSVKAFSSDEVNPPTLTLSEYGQFTGNQIVITPLAAPPAKVRVVSSHGGSSEREVTTNTGLTGSSIPVTVADSVITNEDTPITINVLANDTLNGLPIIFGPDVTVNIEETSNLGTAVVNADGTISYTPNANASGTGGFTYTVSVYGVSSNPGNATIAITPVNDAPVAVNDTATALATIPMIIDVLANDTDIDGQSDLAGVEIVTQPQTGATVTGGSTVTFTADAPGSYTFTYRAKDAAGELSANTATVTVDVTEAETISVINVFRTAARRWVVTGNDNIKSGQTITITYANGVLTNGTSADGTVIGTAVVDPNGTYLFDVRDVTGVLNPTDTTVFSTLPTQIRVSSSLGASQVSTISVRK